MSAPELRFSHVAGHNLIAAPTLVDGALLLVGRDRTVRRLDEDGSEVWVAKLDRGSSASAACAEGLAVVGDESGTVRALDLVAGAERWATTVGAPVAGTPWTGSGVVVLGAGATRMGQRGGGITGVGLEDGVVRWQIEVAHGCRARPVSLDEGVVLGAHDGRVRSLALDGTVRWATEVGAVISGAAAVLGDRVAVPTVSGAIVGLDREDGDQHWRVETGSAAHRAELATDGERVFFGGSDGRLRALDLDGRILWELDRGAGREPVVWGSPAVVGALVVAAGELGSGLTLFGVDRGTGAVVWERGLSGSTASRVVSHGDRLALSAAHGPPSAHVLAMGSGPYT